MIQIRELPVLKDLDQAGIDYLSRRWVFFCCSGKRVKATVEAYFEGYTGVSAYNL